jgi:saccharopine dehydrogenase-like NADP-dependent oxidoreductase
MAPEMVAKVKALVDLGFAGREPVQVGDASLAPRDLMVALMAGNVPPLESFLEPPQNQPPEWTKEIVTEIKGTQDGETVTYRMGTVTLKGSLPTGTVPSITAQWLAGGRVEPGVWPPEAALDPEPFFAELATRGILTQASVTRLV